MKVTIYGQQERMQRVAGHLEALNIEAVVASSLIDCLRQAGEADLVLVDLCQDNAPAICGHLRAGAQTPVVGLVDPHQTEWNNLSGVQMSGFVPVTMNEHELAARLKAMTRWVVTV
jgi:hypothetical protein